MTAPGATVSRRTAFDPATARADGLGSATAIVVIAWFLLALNRFGGSVTQSVRPFVRFVVIGVWAWLLGAAVLWLVFALTGGGTRRSARAALTAVGRAHVPLAAWAVVLFVAAGALRLRWPGLVAAVLVAGWMVWSMATTIAESVGSGRRSVVAVSAAHAVWLATAGRFLADRLGHLF